MICLISEYLSTADLSIVTSKVVREHLSNKLGLQLTERKKEIDQIIMAYVENQVSS